MASRGDAELIRSIGSIVGDVAGMLQATPQELQAARIAADETSQARSMEFQEDMKVLDFQNAVKANEIQRRGNQFETNAELIKAAKLDLANRGVNYETFVADGGSTKNQDNLVMSINRKKENVLGIGQIQLQNQSSELDYLMGELRDDINLQDEARGVFDAARLLDPDGDNSTISEDEWAQMANSLEDDGYDANDIDRLQSFMASEFDKSRERLETERDLEKSRLENIETGVDIQIKRDALKDKEELDEIHAQGYLDESEKGQYIESNAKAYSYDVNLSDSNEDLQKSLNAITGDITQMVKKGVDPYLFAETLQKKVISIFNDKDLGDMGLTDAQAQGFFDSDDPNAELDNLNFTFGRENKEDNKKIRKLLVGLHKFNSKIMDRPLTYEEKLADAQRKADNREQADIDKNKKDKKIKVSKSKPRSAASYLSERLMRTDAGELAEKSAEDLEEWWNTSPFKYEKEDIPNYKKLDVAIKDLVKSKKVVENYKKKTGKNPSEKMKNLLLEKQKVVDKLFYK